MNAVGAEIVQIVPKPVPSNTLHMTSSNKVPAIILLLYNCCWAEASDLISALF